MTDVLTGNWQVMKVLDVPVIYEDEPIHFCGNHKARIFQDFDGSWNLEINLEFVEITFCPFCEVKL